MKKVIAVLFLGSLGMFYGATAIVLQPNNIKNDTSETITVQVTRIIDCLGQSQIARKPQTQTQTTTIGAGDTGKIYLTSGASGGCTSHVSELTVSAPGIESATLTNPEAKDYAVSELVGTSTPTKDTIVMTHKLIIE